MKYYKYKIENLIKVNKIVTVHYFEFDKTFISPVEKHDFWEIVYVQKGKITCTSEGKVRVLTAGEILFHKPDELHSLNTEKDLSPNVIIISFDCKSEALGFFKDKILKCSPENMKLFYTIIKETKNTFDIPYSDPNVRKMPISKNPTLGGLQLIKNYLEILLINLLRGETEIEGKNKVFLNVGDEDGVCKKIVDILTENVEFNIKMDDIVNKLSYSKSYLFRTFKAQMGCSIMAYYNNLKVERAKNLLSNTRLTVTEISEKLGYESQSYFTKAFKKSTLYSPLSYRKIFRK